MEQLAIAQTSSTPLVRFDEATGTLCIAGESYPENSFVFYGPILTWLKQHLKNTARLTLDITIIYMNSSSTKCMLDLLDLLEEAAGKGAEVTAVWRYDAENPRSLELAEEFCEEVTFPFEVVALTR